MPLSPGIRRATLILAALVLLSSVAAYGIRRLTAKGASPRTDLARIRTMVLYEPPTDRVREMPQARLDGMPSVVIDEKTTRLIFADTEYHSGTPRWKGASLAIATLDDGTTVRIAVSYYGGFLAVLGEDGYYTTRGESREALENVHDKAVAEVFIPWRRRVYGP